MAYCSANTDVSALTGITYSTSTVPTLIESNVIIDQVSAEIDVTLASVGISNPSASATFLTMLKKPCALGSAGLLLQRYGTGDGDFRRADWYYSKYEAWLDKVISNEDYKKSILSFFTTGYSGIYVENNVTSGTFTEKSAVNTEVDYMVLQV